MKEVLFEKAGAEAKVEEGDKPSPGENQVLVKSLWTAMNPVDAFASGGYLPTAQSFPVGLGCDASGIIVEAAKGAQQKYNLLPGHYVCGCTRVAQRGYTTAAEYFLMDGQVVLHKPNNLSTKEACTIGAAFQTAGEGIYEGLQIKPPEPGTGGQGSTDDDAWVLVLGGAGSVGRAGVQLARASGHRVIASCSGTSAQSVKKLGVVDTFDYRLSLNEQLEAVKRIAGGAPVTKIFDATSADKPELAQALFEQAGDDATKHFSTTNDWSGISSQQWHGGKVYEISLAYIGFPEATKLNASIEKHNRVIKELFENDRLQVQEQEEFGNGGLEDAAKAYSHKSGSRKVVVKIQDE